jgi:N-formylglutamate amidohydrolase
LKTAELKTRFPRLLCGGLLAILWLCGVAQFRAQTPGTARAGGDDPGSFIFTQRGTIPIILTVPHGGRLPVPGVAERRSGTKVRDEYTDELAMEISRHLERLLGGRPYIVMAKFGRPYVDANRAEKEAFENDKAAPYYRAYHAAARAFVDEARMKWPGGALLIDVHGQSDHPESIMRGTGNGKTVQALVRRAGRGAISGPQSVFGKLEAYGYKVLPPIDNDTQPEELSGNYTLRAYGSQNPDGVDAIQIETGRDIRGEGPAGKNFQKYCKDLAESISTFYRAYLQPSRTKS